MFEMRVGGDVDTDTKKMVDQSVRIDCLQKAMVSFHEEEPKTDTILERAKQFYLFVTDSPECVIGAVGSNARTGAGTSGNYGNASKAN